MKTSVEPTKLGRCAGCDGSLPRRAPYRETDLLWFCSKECRDQALRAFLAEVTAARATADSIGDATIRIYMRRFGPYHQGPKRDVQRILALMEQLADPRHPDAQFFVIETVGCPVQRGR